MGIIYIITVFILFISFILVKKSEKKQNLISIGILSIVLYLAYNIAICLISGCLNIHTDLVFLSVINVLVSFGIGIKIYKDKEIQSYEIRKRDLLAVTIICLISCYIAVDQYKPLSGAIATASVDGCMHYSAATNFANNMIILTKIDNQTGYNFMTMQPGAYINTGIMMSVYRSIFNNAKDFKTFKLFEIGIFTVNILAFYMLISDKLKNKFKYIIGIIFLILYAFAYPYTSLLYGFSYLSVAIAFSTVLFYLAKLYSKNEIEFPLITIMIVLTGIGIIFSYCLFVPALFAFICIFVFIKEKDEKHKILKKQTLIITGILFLVTIIGIIYLVIPTFTVSTQNKLTDAIGFEGGIYKALFLDFVFYIPFVIMFIIKSIKEKEIKYQLIAIIIIVGQTILELAGLILGFVSSYYYYKIYYILWILMVDTAIEVMCNINDNKELQTFLVSYVTLFVLIVLGAVSGIEERLQMRAPGLIEECRLNKLAGIYFDTNIAAVRNINVSCIVDENRVKLAEEVGKIEDINLKNMLVGGMNTNCKAWLYVISGIGCGGESINDLQTAIVDTNVEDWMENEKKKYFVLFTTEKYNSTDKYELIHQNEAGVILKKK